jgi:hypothetical protein
LPVISFVTHCQTWVDRLSYPPFSGHETRSLGCFNPDPPVLGQDCSINSTLVCHFRLHQISAANHRWEESTTAFKTYNMVHSAIKKQIITVVEPMYIEILNDDRVGFANTNSRDISDRLFLSYGSITAVDIEQNFENIRKAWDPQQPVETLFNQIQYCVNFAEAGGVTIGAAQKL